MPTNIDLFPTEILFAIIESAVTTASEKKEFLGYPNICFAHEEILPLSQVNQLVRRLCLPQLYKYIIIVNCAAAKSQSRLRMFELFRRIMEQKPHLAKLVRCVDIRNSLNYGFNLDSLTFLPNLSKIKFPDHFEPLPKLLSAIASHPQLSAAYWDKMFAQDVRSLMSPPSPVGALSRIHVNSAVIALEATLEAEGNHAYLFACNINIHELSIWQQDPPENFSLTILNLSRLHIRVEPREGFLTPSPLWWFPSFLERHRKLAFIEITLWPNTPAAPVWRALRDVHQLTSFCNVVRQQHLVSSFVIHDLFRRIGCHSLHWFLHATLTHSAVLRRAIALSSYFCRTCDLQIFDLMMTMLFKDDFVSVLHQDRHNPRRQPDIALFMDLAGRIASGIPKLGHIGVSEGDWKWKWSVKRDGQGEVRLETVSIDWYND